MSFQGAGNSERHRPQREHFTVLAGAPSISEIE
jgi:hypothetical protein